MLKALTTITAIAVTACTSFGQLGGGNGGTPAPPVYPEGYHFMYDHEAAGINITFGTETLFLSSSMQTPFDYPYIPYSSLEGPDWDIPSYYNETHPNSINNYLINILEDTAPANWNDFVLDLLIDVEEYTTITNINEPPTPLITTEEDYNDIRRMQDPEENAYEVIMDSCFTGPSYPHVPMSQLCEDVIDDFLDCMATDGDVRQGESWEPYPEYRTKCSPTIDTSVTPYDSSAMDCNCREIGVGVGMFNNPPTPVNWEDILWDTYPGLEAPAGGYAHGIPSGLGDYQLPVSNLIKRLNAINHQYWAEINGPLSVSVVFLNFELRVQLAFSMYATEMDAVWNTLNP